MLRTRNLGQRNPRFLRKSPRVDRVAAGPTATTPRPPTTALQNPVQNTGRSSSLGEQLQKVLLVDERILIDVLSFIENQLLQRCAVPFMGRVRRAVLSFLASKFS